MRIDSGFTGLTVVTEIELLRGDPEPVAELLPECLDILGGQPGCRGAALHRGLDEARWLLYSRWDDWDQWNASLFSRRWGEGAGLQLWEAIEQGRLKLSPRLYEVMATV